jgi:DNA excision repair protein ERCC-2
MMRQELTIHDATDWEDIFPYPSPYDKQIRGINEAIDTLLDNGVYVLEGPCGTGKTLIALTAGLSLVRDPDTQFERVLVVTSKKQQIRAFEDDLAEINDHGSDFEGLSLVGKADVCPYVHTGQIPKDRTYYECDSLQDGSKRLMREMVNDGRADKQADAAMGLTFEAQPDGNQPLLEIDGARAPYQESIPEFQGEHYCPFYAQYSVSDYEDEQLVDVDEAMRATETMKSGMEAGTCPHYAMKQMVEGGDVLIGNYKHAFSPRTVEGFTGKIIDEQTILVVDEAHELVSEVRGELSYSVSMQTLGYAVQDAALVYKWLDGKGHPGKQSLAAAMEDRGSFEQSEIKGFYKFLTDIQDLFTSRVADYLDDEYGRRLSTLLQTPSKLSEHSIQIQTNSTDVLEEWVTTHGSEEDWPRALYLAHAVANVRDAAKRKIDQQAPNGDFAVTDVRELLHRWLIGDHTEYFRELLLTPREEPLSPSEVDYDWQQGYKAELRVNNCIPQDEIAGTVDAFGGTILQSATLAPIDVYSEVTGVDKLEAGTQPPASLVTKAAARYRNESDSDSDSSADDVDAGDDVDESGDDDAGGDSTTEPEDSKTPSVTPRTVTRSMFQIDFPKENRESFAVDVPKFTYSDRWPPEDNPTLRNQYEQVITDVVQTTPGNVLVFMPSYQEAAWAGDILDKNLRVAKPVIVDESSSDAETEAMKEEFFEGDAKVLTTGLRGTLTEGVDFAGDKLHATVICGVPIKYTGSELASAIEAAYGYRFGGQHGFDYAFTVPAIRKTRQAIGRVIRGAEDVGVRVVADERYAQDENYSDVREHFPPHERREFTPVGPDELRHRLEDFW